MAPRAPRLSDTDADADSDTDSESPTPEPPAQEEISRCAPRRTRPSPPAASIARIDAAAAEVRRALGRKARD